MTGPVRRWTPIWRQRRTGPVIVLQEQSAPFEHLQLIGSSRKPRGFAGPLGGCARLRFTLVEQGTPVSLGDGYFWIDHILHGTRFDGIAVDADCLAGTPQLHERVAFRNQQNRVIGPHAERRGAGDELRKLDAAGDRRIEPGFRSGGLLGHGRRSRAGRGNDGDQGKKEVHLFISRTTRKPMLLLR